MRRNRVPWVVGGVLILVLVLGSLVCGSGKKKKSAPPPPPPESARAVVLPASRPRMVVVPPCNTPVSDTARGAAGGEAAPGATVVELPQGRGLRTVLVPHCQPTGPGAVNAEGSIPSAAFVLSGDERHAKDREGKIHADGVVAETQLILPDGSDASTIVVPPCVEKEASKGRDIVLSPDEGDSDLAVAPEC